MNVTWSRLVDTQPRIQRTLGSIDANQINPILSLEAGR